MSFSHAIILDHHRTDLGRGRDCQFNRRSASQRATPGGGALRDLMQRGGTGPFRSRHAIPAFVLVSRIEGQLRGGAPRRSRMRNRLLGHRAEPAGQPIQSHAAQEPARSASGYPGRQELRESAESRRHPRTDRPAPAESSRRRPLPDSHLRLSRARRQGPRFGGSLCRHCRGRSPRAAHAVAHLHPRRLLERVHRLRPWRRPATSRTTGCTRRTIWSMPTCSRLETRTRARSSRK